jgi:hypothetical protein
MMQNHYIDLLKSAYGDKNIVLLYSTPYEIKGMERIMEISGALFP